MLSQNDLRITQRALFDSMEVMEEFCEMSGNQLGYSRDFINHAWKKHTLKQTTIF